MPPLHYPLICSLVYHRYKMIKFQLEIFPALVVPLSGKPEPVGLDLWRANNAELWCCCELIQGWWYIFMHQGIGSPLVQPMACCLMAPCCYLQISVDLIKHQSLYECENYIFEITFKSSMYHWVNLLKPNDALCQPGSSSPLVWVIVCHQFNPKLLSEPVQTYCLLDPYEQVTVEFLFQEYA